MFAANFQILLPYRKRDRAHLKLKEMFYAAINKRRNSEPEDDMLQTLLDTPYKSV